jgi:uncharacterized small protein (DUF1192 family)
MKVGERIACMQNFIQRMVEQRLMEYDGFVQSYLQQLQSGSWHYLNLSEHQSFDAIMKVGERIACMQNFIQRMVEQRDLIIKLIMWEIGSTTDLSNRTFSNYKAGVGII